MTKAFKCDRCGDYGDGDGEPWIIYGREDMEFELCESCSRVVENCLKNTISMWV